MRLILCRNKSIGSRLLRLIMWCQWSHSAVLDEEQGIVYDTTLLQGGVKRHEHAQDFFKHYPEFEDRGRLCPVGNDVEARFWLMAQVGKSYDWTALLALVVHRNWQQDDSWFCSELSESIRSLFGTPVFRANASRITPFHQDMIT